ncbi:DUF2776 family protein [Cellulomonas dongxiuzhuiae]|uniref:DUF2776 domain-containing protein n=1 Tax=Cellulomonas dongxiuzhuiae TaxID=2819979 RepID=A0ABX8GM01_9CELL|nr:DUF2776 family protein [Cellulomonas dongxiuzhuiae]MBO3096518.1 DUF2776 family protein [Cellulomonas dongxiuzhuiae]QWC16910.1 DUF2776 domain-containing protein [Cellulomonas dongxiuzhuiae]
MNRSISILFRAIPLVMGLVCLMFGLDILSGGDDAAHFVAGHVNIALTAICIALFTTAATIIRQLVDRYGEVWEIVLPALGYAVAAGTVVWGATITLEGDEPQHVVAGHVLIGIGFIAACVSTVAVASTKFVLIAANGARPPDSGPPDGAYSRRVGAVLVAVPVVLAVTGLVIAATLYARGDTPGLVAAHVLTGLSLICAALVALVASIVRQVRNEFGDAERFRWTWWVVAMGTINVGVGVGVLVASDDPARLAPGTVLIGLGLVCFSILSKVVLLALVWRRRFPLANRIPIIPVGTALTCLFLAAFLFEATTRQPGFFVGAHVLVGLGAVCFTLFSIVSILEAGTSKS